MDALNRRPSARRARGTSMVEMTFVLPVLLVLLFGVAEFSLVFHDYLAAMNAARAGVRAATLTKLNCQNAQLEQDGRKTAEAMLDNSAVKGARTITFEHSAPSAQGLCAKGYVQMKIRVQSDHKLLTAFFADPTFFPPIEFTASAGAMSENGF
jgi:Flp pilus assembly protein TadG